MRVFGTTIEQGGMELDDNNSEVECPECGKTAQYRNWEQLDGGSINRYKRTTCYDCGYDTGEQWDVS